jgi:hypothetical protein
MQQLSGKQKIRKLWKNCGQATFFILCLGMQHVVETPFSAISLGFFPGNTGAVSDEHDERFHQHIPRNEKKIQRQMEPIHAEWTLVWETPTEEYKRQKTTK